MSDDKKNKNTNPDLDQVTELRAGEVLVESRRKILKAMLIGGATVAGSGLVPLPKKWTTPVVKWAGSAVGLPVAMAALTPSPTLPQPVYTPSPTLPQPVLTPSPTLPQPVLTPSPTLPPADPGIINILLLSKE